MLLLAVNSVAWAGMVDIPTEGPMLSSRSMMEQSSMGRSMFEQPTTMSEEERAAQVKAASSPGAAETQQAFTVMTAIGQASNQGQASGEALRQTCGILKEKGSAAVQQMLDRRIQDGSLLAEAKGSKVGSLVYSKGSGAMVDMLNTACLALNGESISSTSSFSTSTITAMAQNYAFEEGVGYLKKSGLPFTGRLEISGDIFSRNGSDFEVLTVQPLWRDQAARNHVFTQLSWNRTQGRNGYASGDTLNAGLGYRFLSESRKYLYGINTFFDHTLERGHNRMSVGADVQTSELGVSMNKYFPVSDWKALDDYIEERASSGIDLELQGRLPELPSWQANLKGYQWSSNQAMQQQTTFGYEVGLQWQPVNALVIEAGLRDEQAAAAEFHTKMQLVYKFGQPLEEMWERPVALASMEERVYGKVRRENAVRIEQRIRDSAYTTVTQTIGANQATAANGDITVLSTGLQLPAPFTVSTSAVSGSVARLVFRNGAILTIGAGSSVKVEAKTITLLAGLLQFVSGSTSISINVPGGKIALLGTDVDVSTNGTTSVLRVRDGSASLTGNNSGSSTITPGQAVAAVSGVVGTTLATTDPTYTQHATSVSEKIDQVAAPQDGQKIAPYVVKQPQLLDSGTHSITIGVEFNAAVAVTGTPQLGFTIAGHTRQASYVSGTGTNKLSFTYTFQPDDAGANTITVQNLSLNGGTIVNDGKDAVITISAATLSLTNVAPDLTPSTGYGVTITTAPINAGNVTAAAFQMSSAEVGTTYNYTISSSGGGTPVTGTGAVTAVTQSVSGINLSGLGDGTLTISLTLTDAGGNVGTPVTHTTTKDIVAPTITSVTAPSNGTYGP